MADWFALQVFLLLLLLSVVLAGLVPALRSSLLSCTSRRRSRRSRGRQGEICSSTPLGKGTRSSRSDLEKLFIPRLERRLDHSQHVVDLSSELHSQDLQDQEQQEQFYTLGDQTLHNLFCHLPEGYEVKEEELSEKYIQDETISDSMVNITFVC